MKFKWLARTALLPLLTVFGLFSCGGGGSSSTLSNSPSAPAETYEYWVGALPSSFYSLNFYGERGVKVTGKPWMVLKRDRISLAIIDCEFGLSEVTQANLTTPSGAATAPVPTLDASTIDYHAKLQLNLTKPAVLCVGWASKSAMVNGFQSFTFTRGSSPGGVGANERWSFSFLSSMLWGGVQNLDTTYFMGNDSDSNAFSLAKL